MITHTWLSRGAAAQQFHYAVLLGDAVLEVTQKAVHAVHCAIKHTQWWWAERELASCLASQTLCYGVSKILLNVF